MPLLAFNRIISKLYRGSLRPLKLKSSHLSSSLDCFLPKECYDGIGGYCTPGRSFQLPDVLNI